MEAENSTLNISAQILIKVLVKRFWILLIIGALSFGIIFSYTMLTFVPEYESTGRLYVLRQRGEDDSQQNADYQVSLLVAADCTHILKDHIVVDAVIDELDLKMSYKKLSDSISVYNPEETRILYVTVTAGDPEDAARIVDSVCSIGARVITDLMGEEQAKFYGKGEVVKTPSNQPSVLLIALISVAIMVVVYGVWVLILSQSEHIGAGDSIKERLGVAVLGDIPNANRRGKFYGRYGKYGQYKQYRNRTEGNKVTNAKEKTK